MTKVDDYKQQLANLHEWRDYLLAHSNLPGPRGNLELAEAVADLAPAAWVYANLEAGPDVAPENTPQGFVVMCAVQALGRLAAEGDDGALERLREAAADSRWRVRESVAIALQRLGDSDMARLLEFASELSRGSYLEQRAAVAAVCEPRLLKREADAPAVFAILDNATNSIASATDRRSDAFRTLRQALGYCCSVAVAAYPAFGRPAFERRLSSGDADVRGLLRENLKKNRLQKLDPGWVDRCLAQLNG
jgi:hypothetical protein